MKVSHDLLFSSSSNARVPHVFSRFFHSSFISFTRSTTLPYTHCVTSLPFLLLCLLFSFKPRSHKTRAPNLVLVSSGLGRACIQGPRFEASMNKGGQGGSRGFLSSVCRVCKWRGLSYGLKYKGQAGGGRFVDCVCSGRPYERKTEEKNIENLV